MDVHAMLRWFYKQPEFFANTVRTKIEEGKLRFQSTFDGATFDTMDEARSHVRAVGVSEVDQFGEGYFGSRMLAKIQQDHPNLRIQQTVFNLQDTQQVEEIERLGMREGKSYGFYVADGNRVRFVQMFDDKEELTTDLVDQHLAKYGLKFPGGGGKPGKRAKAILAEKAIESWIDKPLVVSVHDSLTDNEMGFFRKNERKRLWNMSSAQFAEEYKRDLGEIPVSRDTNAVEKLLTMKTRAAKDKALDGFSVGSKRFFETMEKSLSAELDALKRGVPTSYGEQIKHAQRIRHLEDGLQHLRSVISKGEGVFNFRLVGFDLQMEGSSKEMKQFLKDLKGGVQIKGNIMLGITPDGSDVYTYFKNVSTEGGGMLGRMVGGVMRSLGMEGKRGSFATLSPHGTGMHRTMFDIQTATAHPALYDQKLIGEASEEFLSKIEADFQGMREGRPPHVIIEMLEERLKRADGIDPLYASQIKQMLKRLKGGAKILNDPYLASSLLDIMRLGVGRGPVDKGHRLPTLRMPNTLRGEAIPSWYSGKKMRPRPGEVVFDPKAGWLINPNDASQVYGSFGGFDFDDMLNGMVRIDNNGKLKAVMFRQPTAAGEIAFFNLRRLDPVVLHRLGTVGKAKLVDDYKNKVKELERVEKEAKKWRGKKASIIRRRGGDSSYVDGSPLIFEADTYIRENEEKARRLNQELTQIYRDAGFMDMNPLDNMPRRDRRKVKDKLSGGTKIYDEGGETYRYLGEEPFLDLFEGKQRYREFSDLSDDVVNRFNKLGADKQLRALSAMNQRMYDLNQLTRFMDEGSQHALGIYSNARMMLDHFAMSNADALKTANIKLLNVTLLEQETVIDAWIQTMKGLRDASDNVVPVEEIAKGMQRSVMHAIMQARKIGIGRDQIAMDEMLFNEKVLGRHGYNTGEIREMFEDLKAKIGGVDDLQMESLFFEEGDARATITQAYKAHEAAMEKFDAIAKEVGMSQDIMNMHFGSEASRDAERLMGAYRDAVGMATRNPLLDMDLVSSDMMDLLAREGIGEVAGHNVLRELAGMSEVVDGKRVLGPRALAAVARMGQQIQHGGDISRFRFMASLSEFDFIEQARQWAAGEDFGFTEVDELYNRVGRVLRHDDRTESFLRGLMGTERFNALSRMESAFADGTVEVSSEMRKVLIAAGFSPGEDYMLSPLDPRNMMKMGDEYVSLGELLLRNRNATLGMGQLALRESFNNYFNALDEMMASADMGVSPSFRQAYIEALEGTEFGTQAAARAKKAADASSELIDSKSIREGVKALWEKKYMKYSVIGMAAFAGLGAYYKVRDKDHTLQDMQGPANLPGGNPYTDMGFDSPQITPPEQYIPSFGGGTTYEVDAHGAGADESLFEELLQAIGGSSASGSIYDGPSVPEGGFSPHGYRGLN